MTLTSHRESALTPSHADAAEALQQELSRWFQIDFTIYNGSTGQLINEADSQPSIVSTIEKDMITACGELFCPQFIVGDDHLEIYALPVRTPENERLVATAAFVLREVDPQQAPSPEIAQWIESHPVQDPATIERLGQAVFEKLKAESRVDKLEREVHQVSDNIASTYEEISLVYKLIENLRLTKSDEQLAELALQSLGECLPCTSFAVQLLAVAQEDEVTYKFKARTHDKLLTIGDCPLDQDQFSEFVSHIGIRLGDRPFVANRRVTGKNAWPYPNIRQAIIAPLFESNNLFGWIAAFNHQTDDELGTIEASLLKSIGGILGIHAGNRELYRRQAEFLASVVRALTSAIDAKDPYTSGHSDRVARIAVRLGQELNCDSERLSTIYMSALLHDIGKIGIDDSVLCKAGRLTSAEYEHIKMHPELGHRILADIRELSDCLPVVLHHHEQWDGYGYPRGLEGESIPFLARVAAVADAYDAMSSDRPYRKGLPQHRVESILRQGAGRQWDAQVIDAFFACRDDILEICNHERENLTLDVEQWV